MKDFDKPDPPPVDPADLCRDESDGMFDMDSDIEEANRRLENRSITATRLEDRHGAERLSQEGWIILKVVQMSEITPVNKNFVFMQQGNSYPQTFSYTENEVTRSAMFVMGRPMKDEIERIRRDQHSVSVELEVARKRIAELEQASTWQKKQIEIASADKSTFTKLLDERSVEKEQQRERAIKAEKELEQIKAGLAKTFVRLGDGQEATIPEVAEMQKSSDILMNDPPF